MVQESSSLRTLSAILIPEVSFRRKISMNIRSKLPLCQQRRKSAAVLKMVVCWQVCVSEQ
ncbi:hypothetical protein CLOBOL_01293 [Enterocloster bolteae ATCC BAA-613]|uniref:Uncharacterized protein n=1 Tax=Enterocloster bolteae (strain ATCC BAA-613 / DSM 15670 / CCUG 46953 / JCM 12243 / WAL 16351) TaxID=411902 RepID=A8RKF0_ENTBW|nr:hypothetical protein CLOBOL_01293 [Enterocloster bolteae ATCC BAA-613]